MTGRNSGKWTIVFDPVAMNFTVPEVLVYKININGQFGSSFNIAVDLVQHDVNVFGNQNSWYDESDTLLIKPSETLYFFYSNPVADGIAPVATIFLRYDTDKWGESY